MWRLKKKNLDCIISGSVMDVGKLVHFIGTLISPFVVLLRKADRRQRCHYGTIYLQRIKLAPDSFKYKGMVWECWGPDEWGLEDFDSTQLQHYIRSASACGPFCPVDGCHTELTYKCGLLWSKFYCPRGHFTKRTVNHRGYFDDNATRIARGKLRTLVLTVK